MCHFLLIIIIFLFISFVVLPYFDMMPSGNGQGRYTCSMWLTLNSITKLLFKSIFLSSITMSLWRYTCSSVMVYYHWCWYIFMLCSTILFKWNIFWMNDKVVIYIYWYTASRVLMCAIARLLHTASELRTSLEIFRYSTGFQMALASRWITKIAGNSSVSIT